MKTNLTRRSLFHFTGKLALATLALQAASSLALPIKALAEGWSRLLKHPPQKGAALVKTVTGKATAGGRPLSPGDKVASGKLIEVETDGRLLLSLHDGSLLNLKGPAKFAHKLGPDGGGLLSLMRGALSAVIMPGKTYLVQGVTATIGIKGTVFHHEVLEEAAQKEADIPKGSQEYFCLCHGAADYLDQEGNQVIHPEKSHHHTARWIGGGKLVGQGGLRGHDDSAIRALINQQQPGKQHDATWLQDK